MMIEIPPRAADDRYAHFIAGAGLLRTFVLPIERAYGATEDLTISLTENGQVFVALPPGVQALGYVVLPPEVFTAVSDAFA